MVYILKGWVIFKYENEGEFKLKEGDCVHQIPGIKHEEIEHSVDVNRSKLMKFVYHHLLQSIPMERIFNLKNLFDHHNELFFSKFIVT